MTMQAPSMQRRAFLGAMAAAVGSGRGIAATRKPIRAVAFDAFVIFDGRSIVAAARETLGDRGAAFAGAWLQKLFGNTWLLTSAGRYQAFETVAEASLISAAETAGLALSAKSRSVLLKNFSRLGVWPDVPPALSKLRDAGIRTCILSNLSEGLLASNLEQSGLASQFDAVLSTDRVGRYKPAPAAYAMGPQAFGLPIAEIGFAAFGGWDAVGATWFGFPTVWVNRSGAAREWLDAAPKVTSRGIDGVLTLTGIA
jgi:2-haloacid dehalogenase